MRSQPVTKRLEFYSISQQNNFNISAKETSIKNKNCKYDISTFDLNFEKFPIEEENENDYESAFDRSSAQISIKKEGLYSFIENPRKSILIENKETEHYENILADLKYF